MCYPGPGVMMHLPHLSRDLTSRDLGMAGGQVKAEGQRHPHHLHKSRYKTVVLISKRSQKLRAVPGQEGSLKMMSYSSAGFAPPAGDMSGWFFTGLGELAEAKGKDAEPVIVPNDITGICRGDLPLQISPLVLRAWPTGWRSGWYLDVLGGRQKSSFSYASLDGPVIPSTVLGAHGLHPGEGDLITLFVLKG